MNMIVKKKLKELLWRLLNFRAWMLKRSLLKQRKLIGVRGGWEEINILL